MFYPEELIEEIRNKNDIVSVIGTYIRLQKKGNNHMGLCPFHNEKTPSFSVSQNKQLYHCFGCGVGGNVYTFIMEYENYSYIEAVRYLAERVGIQLPEQEYSEEARRQADLKFRLFEVNKEAAKYFYYQLKQPGGQEAYNYLVDRGINDAAIKHFGLGFANRYSDDLYKYLKKLGYEDEFLKETGLVFINEQRGGHDKFWDRIMFPIMDANHRVIAFGGRIMGNAGSEIPKYMNSPETRIFDKSRNLYGLNFARASRAPNLILCEGYMDTIALHMAGFNNAVAALGTAFTSFHANLIKRYANEVLLSFDSDAAGTKAALRAIPILKENGITVKVIDMKPYKDPDEFIKNLGAEEFRARINEAKNSFFYEIDVLQNEYDLNDPEQKTGFFNETAKKLLGFSDELERNFYIEAVAKAYFINESQLRTLVNRLGAKLSMGIGQPSEYKNNYDRYKKANDDGIVKSQKLMLTWLVDKPDLFIRIKDLLEPSDFTQGLLQEVAKLVFEQYEKDKAINPAKIISCFNNLEEQTDAASIFSAEIKGDINEADFLKALADTLYKIKQNSLDAQSLRAIEVNDIELLQKTIAEKAELKRKVFSIY